MPEPKARATDAAATTPAVSGLEHLVDASGLEGLDEWWSEMREDLGKGSERESDGEWSLSSTDD
jgi:hypothetical protein